MSYLGKVALKASDIRRLDVTSSTSATHTLTWTPPSEQSLIITINGVKQQNNYSISGTTLTLDTALVATDEMEVIGINDIGTTTVPGDGTVTTAKIEDDAVTADKLANSINTEIAANTAKVTNATHTGDVTGATALTIAAGAVDLAMLSASGTASATTFLRGDNSWAAISAEDNAPSFSAVPSTNQVISSSTWTKMEFGVEQWDVGSNFDHSTNYRFTAPAAGKYMFRWGVTISSVPSTSHWLEAFMYVNGSGQYRGSGGQSWGGSDHNPSRSTGIAVELDADDYVEVYVNQNTGTGQAINGSRSYFQGFLLAGV
jgi:hypothetical protein